MLTKQDIAQILASISDAVTLEWPQVDELLRSADDLEILELGWRTANAVAPVASDGGEAGIAFHPMNLEFVRVVDSDGQVHVQELVSLSTGPKPIKDLLRREPVASLANHLGVEDPLDLFSQYMSKIKGDAWPVDMRPADLRDVIAHIRDVVEWAVLLKLAWEPTSSKRLVIRDGLLRTMALHETMVQRLSASFQRAYDERGAMLVAVAKRSQLLSYMSIALELGGTFRRPYACFAEVPKELMRRAYRGRNWIGGYGFGIMHLAKLAGDPDGLVIPVDVPFWLMDRRREALEYLANTAQGSFPQVGYPYPLVRAHELASMSSFDISVVADIVIRQIMATRNADEAERILRHITLGRGLTKGGYRT